MSDLAGMQLGECIDFCRETPQQVGDLGSHGISLSGGLRRLLLSYGRRLASADFFRMQNHWPIPERRPINRLHNTWRIFMTRRAWPFHNDGDATLPVAIIETGNKHLAVAVIVGDFSSNATSEHGRACIEMLDNAVAIHGLKGQFRRIEIATEATTPARIEMAIAAANDGDTIVFMCAKAAIFDAAWRALDVRKWS